MLTTSCIREELMSSPSTLYLCIGVTAGVIYASSIYKDSVRYTWI